MKRRNTTHTSITLIQTIKGKSVDLKECKECWTFDWESGSSDIPFTRLYNAVAVA